MPQKSGNFVIKYKIMEANIIRLCMNIVEQAKVGTTLAPDNFTTCGIFDVIQSGLTCLCSNGKSYRFAKGIYDIPLLYNK